MERGAEADHQSTATVSEKTAAGRKKKSAKKRQKNCENPQNAIGLSKNYPRMQHCSKNSNSSSCCCSRSVAPIERYQVCLTRREQF
jgi:hypothetical protein